MKGIGNENSRRCDFVTKLLPIISLRQRSTQSLACTDHRWLFSKILQVDDVDGSDKAARLRTMGRLRI